MANRYQERPFPADDDYGHQADRARPKSEGDPLAELARLIGQTDPFSNFGREVAASGRDQPQYEAQPEPEEEDSPAGPPPWMQRANAHETRQQDLGHRNFPPRYVAPESEPQHDYHQERDYHQAPSFAADTGHEQVDPDRYDDALYGQVPGQELQAQEAYSDDPYAYQDGYADEVEEQAPKRRSGLTTVVVVLALAVVGTGAAFAYRTYLGPSRSGEPPVIKADTGPNKIIPPSSSSTADASGKLIQDRLGGAAPEKMVSREEQPVNVQDNTAAGPRVVFPPLNQNANPPSTASVSPAGKPMTGNGSMQGGDEPRKIRTFAVRGDQDPNATPAAKQVPPRTGLAPVAPAPAARPNPSNANAAAPNAPLSLSPQAAPVQAAPPARVAAMAPQQAAPAAASSGGYLVQVSSQRNEADAQASFRALQSKFPSVLGSRAPLIKRADLGEKGTYYRSMVGPFGTPEEASQFCGNLKSAGGQCVVQRN